MTPNYKILSVCSHVPTKDYYLLQELINSLKGVQPLWLGTGKDEYGGLATKLRIVHKAISDGLVKEKHIIICDAFDVVFATTPEQVINDFLDFEVPIVIGAEKNCFPEDLKSEYDNLPFTSSYKYLNSGMVVGETEAIYTLLKHMGADKMEDDYWDIDKGCRINPNDQFEYQKIFLQQPVPMALDYNQILCNNLNQVEEDELDFSGVRIRNKETKYCPCSFHFNGASKSDGISQPILEKLNLR